MAIFYLLQVKMRFGEMGNDFIALFTYFCQNAMDCECHWREASSWTSKLLQIVYYTVGRMLSKLYSFSVTSKNGGCIVTCRFIYACTAMAIILVMNHLFNITSSFHLFFLLLPYISTFCHLFILLYFSIFKNILIHLW